MNRIRKACEALLGAFGPQGWWPSETTFETAIGAVLTQGTAWTNAERAVAALRERGLLSPENLSDTRLGTIERLVRPAGFYRRKARTLAALARAAGRTTEGWERLLACEPPSLRSVLLGLPGIGPETADVILLYAAGVPVFVVDEYARRFAVRHGLTSGGTGYSELQTLFARALPADAALLAECHALLVKLGKEFCRARPLCAECPLKSDLPAVGRPGPLP